MIAGAGRGQGGAARAAVWAAGLAVALWAALAVAGADAARARKLVAVQANVGNINLSCEEQVFKLCLRPVEERATAALQELHPDVVGFEEILPPELCTDAPSTNPSNLCSGPLEPRSQVRRLLGNRYLFRCDDRFGWDCLAARDRYRLYLTGRLETRPVVSACDDSGFTLNIGTVRLFEWPITTVVAHPDSMDAACRAAQIRDLFESLPPRAPALLLGDWNLDPYRDDDESVRYWSTQVPSRFKYASSDEFTFVPGSSQLDPTGEAMDVPGAVDPAGPFRPRTIDHVLVRGLRGSCEVQRIDGGGGMDHRAQICRLRVPRKVTPRMRFVPTNGDCAAAVRFHQVPPHLRSVRFRIAGRVIVDRKPPYRARRRGGERRRPYVLASARPLLTNGKGPNEGSALGHCKGPARPPPPPQPIPID